MSNKKAGYISIESILVVGIMMVLCVSITVKNKDGSQKLVNTSLSAMDELMDSYNGDSSGGSSSGGSSSGGGSSGGNFSDIPNSPEALPLSRHSMATVKIDNKIYAIGGIANDNNTARRELTVLDTTTGKWTVLKPMPTALYSISATVSQDKKVIHVHGYSGVMSYTSSYTISSNTWMTPTSLWDKYADSTLFMLNNKATLLGGIITDNVTEESHTNMSLISPENAGVLGTGIEASLADVMVVGDDEIYAIGGKLTTSYQLYKYTPSIDKWVKVANAPTRNVHKGYKATYSDGYIYLLGLNTFYAYDIYLGTWRTLATPPISNTYMGISIVGDYLYTISGTSGADTHVYCISSNTWVY